VTVVCASQDNPEYPYITYRTGAAGLSTPILRGTGIRVQTFVVAHHIHGETPQALAEDYDLAVEAVIAALAYYEKHREVIDALLRIEDELAED
jgi:uncharacterized protein (DUF433 family)